MNILFRYMLREYVKIFGMCFAGLMTIYLVIDFFEKVRRFLRYDAHALDVLAYFVLKMPAISYQIAPLAVLMATLLTIGLLSRSHEITAMRSCGISLYWITSPFLFLGTVLAMVLFLFSSTVIPLALAKAEQIKTTRIEKRALPVSLQAAQPWVSLGGQTLTNIDTLDPGGAVLRKIRLYRLSPTFELEQIAEAQRAVYSPQGWVLEDGIRRSFRQDGTVSVNSFQTEPLPLAQIPDDFTTWLELDSETMTLPPADGLLRPDRLPLRDLYYGGRRHCLEPPAHRRARQRHGHGHRTSHGRRILLLVHPFRGNCAGTRRGTCADAGRLDGQSGISDVWLLSAVEGPLLRGSRNSPPAAFAIRQSQHRSRVPDAYSIDCSATVR